MSNAKTRKRLECMSAPVVAWLMANDYVVDDCGILNLTWKGVSHIREATIVAVRSLNGAREVPCPGCGTTSDAHSIMCRAPIMSKTQRDRVVRERL